MSQPMNIYWARPTRSSHTPPATSKFQPTRHCGARRRRVRTRGSPPGFQPTRPYGARLLARMDAILSQLQFQPTRPYGARLAEVLPGVLLVGVSTHAPLWGATATATAFSPSQAVFQPTRPYGARLDPPADDLPQTLVSTHAPLWGATLEALVPTGKELVSTHAPLWGATMIEPYTATMAQFQPTRPYGARPRRAGGKRAAPSFNPRAPMGRDHAQEAAQANPLVSTHAPLWGATPLKRSFAISSFEFQPTRPYGARPDDIRATKKKLEFQPTRPYGARPGTACACTRAFRFQPTRPYGARPVSSPRAHGRNPSFNPRAPIGRDILVTGKDMRSAMFQPTRPYRARLAVYAG